MLFRWLKQRRRQKLLAEPFPAPWLDILHERVALYRFLDPDQQARLRDTLRILVAEKAWEGCKGLVLTDDIRVTIAALMAVLVLGLKDAYYDNAPTILVYPQAFRVPEQHPIGGGVAMHSEGEHLGEAHYRGPVILSWADIEEDAAQPGFGENLVFHEFAHQLDMENGDADGVPLLPPALRRRWQQVMAPEFQRLRQAADRQRRTLLDPYGATNEAEFFAVATEEFFDRPLELRDVHPRLYDLLREYYRVEPAAWFERMG
ncbi:MAG: zinc-dependent peptidase [Gemmataceae bacterium]|nr:zinc-dependent peptidase [Gemmataceae bacterium]